MRLHMLVVGLVTFTVTAILAAAVPQRGPAPLNAVGAAGSPSSLMGTIRTPDGKPLDGVTVSARTREQTFTTSVYTDAQGEYVFPTLSSGTYQVWAQAVGFATARTEVTVDGSRATVQGLTLSPVADFTSQLTGTEWLDALPDDTAANRRMKQILRVGCSDCHSLAVVLQNRFDEEGWRIIVRSMEETSHSGWTGRRNPPDDQVGFIGPTIRRHRDELAKYLASMRGPGPSPMVFKPLPRPSGDAARAVVTEYDLPIGERPNELAWYSGDEWSEGPAVGTHGIVGPHDVLVDPAGNAWLSESRRSFETDRTLVKLDVKTGKTTAFKLTGPDGHILDVEQMALDPKGALWFHTNQNPILMRLDAATETFTFFSPPRLMGNLSNSTDSDSQGRIWVNARYGSVRFDPATGKWQLFQQRTPANGTTYGVAADANDNGWWSQFYADLVAHADTKTGQVYEIPMRDPEYDARKKLATPADLEFYESIGGQTWEPRGNLLPYASAPRRMASDKTGNTVWVPNWAGMNLAEIDIHTRKVTYHPLPIHGHPYSAAVDKQHNAWAVIPLGDSVVKLDPRTKQWTVYRLPSHGCGSRHFSIDDVRGEVWVPCDQSSRVARFQFRTAQQIQAQKKVATAAAGR